MMAPRQIRRKANSTLAPSDDFVCDLAEPLNFELDQIALLEQLRRLEETAHAGRSSSRDHIAGLKRDASCDVRDDLVDRMNQIRGGRILAQLAVDLAAQFQRMRIGNFVRADQCRTEGRERIEGFAAEPLFVTELAASRRNIVALYDADECTVVG